VRTNWASNWYSRTRSKLNYTFPQGFWKDLKIGKRGACDLFRHTIATLMLEGGADIPYIQAMLRHADLKRTEIYTRVSMEDEEDNEAENKL